MKPYHELSELGKIRRLHHLVWKALEDYDLQVTRVEFLTKDTNTMFQVRTVDGGRYVLRIYSDEGQ